MKTKTPTGYVITSDNTVLLQVRDDDSRWGFYLCDDDQSWDGGFGIASQWSIVSDDDPRITPEDHERLDHILEDLRSGEET